jgi:hypothetical protein
MLTGFILPNKAEFIPSTETEVILYRHLTLYIPGTPKWDARHDFLQITLDLLRIWISCVRDGFRIELHGSGGIFCLAIGDVYVLQIRRYTIS